MATIEPIKIEGLREFQRALKGMDADLPKALRVELNTAVDLVVSDARPRIPRRTGRAAATLKGQSTQTKARVKAGGNRARYFPWLDFGGVRIGRGGGRAERQFREKGRYVWLSYSNKRDKLLEALLAGLIGVARQAGLEVSNG